MKRRERVMAMNAIEDEELEETKIINPFKTF